MSERRTMSTNPRDIKRVIGMLQKFASSTTQMKWENS